MTPDHLIYLLILLSGFILGLRRYQVLQKPGRLLTYLLGFIFFLEILNFALPYFFDNNQPSQHLTTIGLTLFYTLIYRSLLIRKYANWPLIVGVAALVVIMINLLFFEGIDGFPSINMGVLTLLVLSCALLNFWQMLQNPNLMPISVQFPFWFNVGNLIFYGITFPVMIFAEYLMANNVISKDFWGWNLIKVANFFLYSCYIYALICQSRQPAKHKNGFTH